MDKKQILEMLKSGDVDVQREGAWAAGEKFLQEAVSELARLLATGNVGVQEAADFALRKIGGKEAVEALIPLLRVDQVVVRNLAMDILRAIGGQNLHSLVRLLQDSDPDVRIFAADILGTSGRTGAVSALSESLLTDSEVNVRYQAAVSLGELGHHEAVDALSRALEEDEEWVQFAVIEALLKIGDSSVINMMVETFDRSSEFVSAMVVDALGEMGEVRAIPLLLKRLDTSSLTLRNKILKALVKLTGEMFFSFLAEEERERIRDFLVIALDDEDESVQDAAIKGLSFFGEEAGLEKVLRIVARIPVDVALERREFLLSLVAKIGFFAPVYEQALSEKDESLAMVVVEALSLIGDEGGADLLLKYFEVFSRDVQTVMSKTLSRIAQARHEHFFVSLLRRKDLDASSIKDALYFLGDRMAFADVDELVISFLEHPYDDVKEAALNACIAINTEKIIEKMLEMSKSSDSVQRLLGVYGLGRLEPKKFQDVFHRCLKDEFSDVRRVALEFLFKTSKEEEMLSVVAACLQDESKDVRLAAVEMLQKSSLEIADRYLISALQHDDDWVKTRAIEALGERRVQAAVSDLITLLDYPFQVVPVKAVKALGKIRGEAALKALIGLLGASDGELQAVVASTLENMQNECKGDAQW